MRLLVLHGPNLNLLGVREGTAGGSLADLDAALEARAEELGLELKVVQSNHEGVLLDTLAEERESVDGIIINPAGLFGSYPLKEGLEAVGLPAIEVLFKAPSRESVVGEACVLQVHGPEGHGAYLQALETFASGVFTPGKPGPVKTPGRKQDSAPAPVKPVPLKSLGRRQDGAPVAASSKSLRRAAAAGGQEKTLGRKGRSSSPATDLLTRALVRQKISERLAGRLTSAELSAWARTQWQAVQRGAPAESGHRELLEESLQSLTLSSMPATRLSDEQFLDLLTRLDEG